MSVGAAIVDAGEESRNIQYERKKSFEKIKIRIEDSGAGNSIDILKEYKEVEDRDTFLARELSDLEGSKTSLHNLIADLDARIDVEFKEGTFGANQAKLVKPLYTLPPPLIVTLVIVGAELALSILPNEVLPPGEV